MTLYLGIFPYTIVQKLLAKTMRRMAGEQELQVDENHPANKALRGYMSTHSEGRSRWAPNYYYLPHHMQTNDELDSKLMELGRQLPEYCYSVCYGYPILVYPRGGVIFAIASGRMVIALRLPQGWKEKALASTAEGVLRFEGSSYHPPVTWYANELGDDWVFIFPWHSEQDLIRQIFLVAYDYAGELARGVAD